MSTEHFATPAFLASADDDDRYEPGSYGGFPPAAPHPHSGVFTYVPGEGRTEAGAVASADVSHADAPEVPGTRTSVLDGVHFFDGYADTSYADTSYADTSYADTSYADASYADASYADASYADEGVDGALVADEHLADAPQVSDLLRDDEDLWAEHGSRDGVSLTAHLLEVVDGGDDDPSSDASAPAAHQDSSTGSGGLDGSGGLGEVRFADELALDAVSASDPAEPGATPDDELLPASSFAFAVSPYSHSARALAATELAPSSTAPSGGLDDDAAAVAPAPVPSPFGHVDLDPLLGHPLDDDAAGAGSAPVASPFGDVDVDSFLGGAVEDDHPAAAPTPAISPFGAVPAPREPEAAPVPVPAPVTAGRTSFLSSLRPSPAVTVDRARASKRQSPVLVVALGGGALALGALLASTLLPQAEVDSSAGLVSVPGVVSTPSPSASADPTATPSPTTGPVVPGSDRDPFVALVAAPAAQPTDGATTGTGLPGDAATGGTGLGTGTGTGLGTGFGTGTGFGAGTGTGTGTGTGSGTSTGSGSQTTSQTAVQTCTAVAGPMQEVELALAASAAGTTAPATAGTQIRQAVAAMRAAVDAASSDALGSRLDIATSSAEALRSQLLAGTPATADQAATQTARDDDVRAACA